VAPGRGPSPEAYKASLASGEGPHPDASSFRHPSLIGGMERGTRKGGPGAALLGQPGSLMLAK